MTHMHGNSCKPSRRQNMEDKEGNCDSSLTISLAFQFPLNAVPWNKCKGTANINTLFLAVQILHKVIFERMASWFVCFFHFYLRRKIAPRLLNKSCLLKTWLQSKNWSVLSGGHVTAISPESTGNLFWRRKQSYLRPQKEWRYKKHLRRNPTLGAMKNKSGGKCVFWLARLCYCRISAKLMFIFKVLVSCLIYLKQLTRMDKVALYADSSLCK